MGSAIPFDFLTIRELQKNCSHPPQPTPVSKDDPLRARVDSAKDSALTLLGNLVEENETTSASANPDTNILHKALLLRSEVYQKKHDLARAKNDVERAIILKPFYTEPYGSLSQIESKRGQFGRAEVALRLGLLVDQGNDRLNKLLSALRNRDDVYPDVSSKRGADRKIRDEHQLAGYELAPPFPGLLMAVMTGNLEALKKLWEPAMKDFKYGRVKNPLMHFPVLGAQRFSPVHPNGRPDPKGAKQIVKQIKSVIDFLFDNGVRLDGRDRIGYTAIMHASAHKSQPELLEHFLMKGADPDLRSCYGSVALMDGAMNQSERVVDILMKYGADPYIADNDGMKPIKFGENFPKIIAVFDRYLKEDVPGKICSRCTKAGTKRCVKCRVVYYCGKECQVEDWSAHKARCKVLCKSHKRVAISNENPVTSSVTNVRSAAIHNLLNDHLPDFLQREMYMDNRLATDQPQIPTTVLFDAYSAEWRKKGNLLLKIQARTIPAVKKGKSVPVGYKPDPNGSLLAYNEERSFQCLLDPVQFDAPELLAIIEDKGVMGVKAYFWAFMEPGKEELIVITDPIHPAQAW